MHLEADLHDAIAWANGVGRRWAFSLSNAGAVYTQFGDRLDQLDEIHWQAIAAADWRAADVKERKQAEFLMHKSFPWELVSRIGVKSMRARSRVAEAIRVAHHQPKIDIKADWYYQGGEAAP